LHSVKKLKKQIFYNSKEYEKLGFELKDIIKEKRWNFREVYHRDLNL